MTTARTIETVGNKINQIRDASDEGYLIQRNRVASGWIACLRPERLLDEHTLAEGTNEKNQTTEEVQVTVVSRA